MPKKRHIVLRSEGDVTGNTSSVGSQTMTSEKPSQPDITTHGTGSRTEDMCQTQAEGRSHDTSKAIPVRLPAPIRLSEGIQDEDPLDHADLYDTKDIAQDEQKTEATGRKDVLGGSASHWLLFDVRRPEDSTMDYSGAANVTDQEPQGEIYGKLHAKHEATTAANVPTSADQSKQGSATALFAGVGGNAMTESVSHPHHHDLTDSSTTFVEHPTSPKGKQVELAPEVSASDNRSEAEVQPAPRTPPPTRRPRRTRTAKNALQATVTRSPPATGSAEKRMKKKKATEAAATQAASPPPRKGPRKIILHFKRKSKAETDADVAPESEAAGGSNTESTQTPCEPRARGGSFCDGDADKLDAAVDEDADGEEEVELL